MLKLAFTSVNEFDGLSKFFVKPEQIVAVESLSNQSVHYKTMLSLSNGIQVRILETADDVLSRLDGLPPNSDD
jgi:hypothetical protein